ncbi:MAG: histidinol-phosphate transaminase [Dehalococcoidales bacterium]|nr:histidinol-phosphate transaminase [Dehalococcoidales bacterium]
MKKYFSEKYDELVPYVPGEQPQDRSYVKLNTNESPFPPSSSVTEAVRLESQKLNLYSDPESLELRKQFASVFGVDKDEVIMVNGSDEVLNFAFMAFADEKSPLAFPDITYGFYPVFAKLNRIPYTEIPVKDDLSIDVNDYIGINKTVVIANPNAPTGLFLSLDSIEKIVASNPNNVVIVDEAYVDFGGQSAISLIRKYDNLLVIGTFSKSRSMAGARLGFGIANKELIGNLNTIRYSTNPYNVNRMTSAAGIAALRDNDYYMDNCKTIIANRDWTADALKSLGFEVLDSKANFVFARTDKLSGEQLYLKLKENGVLVRHFKLDRIKDYNRITIGTLDQMKTLIEKTKLILEGK